jgi:hypothetical protein
MRFRGKFLCPNCSCRSLLIVSLSFSISSRCAFASASAAKRAARSARTITGSVVIVGGRILGAHRR